MRLAGTLIVLSLLATLPAPLRAAPDDRGPQEGVGTRVVGDGIIVPGYRIGPLRLGMSIEQILQAMPPGYRREVFTTEGIILYEWRAVGIWVSLDAGTQAVRLISTFGMGPYTTDRGVRLLQSEAKIHDVYGKETRRYDYSDERVILIRYVPLGLQFGVVNEPGNALLHDRIFTIGIFLPGHEPPPVKPPTT